MSLNIDLLLEKYLGTVKETWKKKDEYTEVFINPTNKELRDIYGNDREFAIIIPNNKDVIAFNRNTLHQSVIDQLNVRGDYITASAFVDGKEIDIMVTDATRNGKWHHNPKIEDYIKSNKYLSRHWKEFTFSYYDEPIFGSWVDG